MESSMVVDSIFYRMVLERKAIGKKANARIGLMKVPKRTSNLAFEIIISNH